MQNFGNDFVLFVHYIFYKRSVPMVFVGCLDAGDPMRCSAASCGMNRRSESIVRCVCTIEFVDLLLLQQVYLCRVDVSH